jgi:heme exporter protein C
MFNPGAMSIEMKWPALAMLFGFMFYFGAVLFVRLRAEVIRRERNATWLKEELAR